MGHTKIPLQDMNSCALLGTDQNLYRQDALGT